MGRNTLLLLAMVLAAVCAMPRAAQADERIGEVSGLTGPVVVIRGDTPAALFLGAAIHSGDFVRTMEGAKLSIAFDDGSELVLGADSQVSMTQFAPEEGEGVFDLLEGILRVAIQRAGDWRRFTVGTRHAVASARSTEWVMDLTREGTAAFVVEGRIAVRAAGQEVLLAAGEGVDVAPDEAPGPPTEWGAARVDEVLARTTLP